MAHTLTRTHSHRAFKTKPSVTANAIMPTPITGTPVRYPGARSQCREILLSRTGNLQEDKPCLTGEVVGTQASTWSFTHYARHGQLAFASPVNTRYPLMLYLGGLLPQLTPGHQVPMGRLEQCEEKFLAQERNNTNLA